MTPSGHDAITAAAQWCRRATPGELAAFGLPYRPFLGCYRIPIEETLCTVLGRLDPGEISVAGYDHLRPLLSTPPRSAQPFMPDGGIEREQRRAHRTALRVDPMRSRRRAIAVDGTCPRGAKRPDGSRVFVCSAVRHRGGITVTFREIGAKTNEIPEFAPLLSQVHDADLKGAVVTADALHTQRDHTVHVHRRGAHYLLTINNNQRKEARQLHALPWKDIPVIHRDDSRGHGRHEQRLVQVVTVNGPALPLTPPRSCASSADAVSTGRRSGPARAVYTITDLPAEEANAAEIAARARGH
ncbi:transposase [Streptomyces sp. NPDC005529]|uniref:transposase n=1 Tax=unclassified Streptomyces TaxID=2593676 RepID=UPI0033A696B6